MSRPSSVILYFPFGGSLRRDYGSPVRGLRSNLQRPCTYLVTFKIGKETSHVLGRQEYADWVCIRGEKEDEDYRDELDQCLGMSDLP